MRITIWNEYRHERAKPEVAQIYPQGIHEAIRAGLADQLGTGAKLRVATLDEPENGLPEKVLNDTDVLLWWGHGAHAAVADDVVDRVQDRVLNGMGLIVLHSAHASRIFQRLMGTGCMLRWREAGERERLWIVAPWHPIVEGLPEGYFELPATEMYGEFFDIPNPDELIFISWFQGGEVFRSGCTFRRGKGKIFYFRPGHETYPIYYDANVRRVIANAARWAMPSGSEYQRAARNIAEPLERLGPQA